jgi:glycosyltransferase involved in cell wall biosynthesis
VSDYTCLLARALAEAGDEVHVWAPACPGAAAPDDLVSVHRLPGRFGPSALAQLDAVLTRQPRSHRLLVQYVPHGYGWKAMNVLFCSWLLLRRPAPWVMFHEVAFPCVPGQRLVLNLMGVVHRLMASMVARAAGRIFVSIPAWETLLRQLVPRLAPVTWLPVPSTVAAWSNPVAAAAIRRRLAAQSGTVIGHFGTFGAGVAERLAAVLPPLLHPAPGRVGLLVGRHSQDFANELLRRHQTLRGRLHATGEIPPEAVAEHLRACDLLVQPYPDGVSGRRTSVMAGLALGLPIVSTDGPLTENVWRQEGLVALAPADHPAEIVTVAEGLLSNVVARRQLGARGRDGYARYFSLEHTVRTLRAAWPAGMTQESGTRPSLRTPGFPRLIEESSHELAG